MADGLNKDIYEDEMSRALTEQNYKKYYNQMLQLYNVGQKANQYYQNSLQKQGLNGTGEGGTASILQNNGILNAQQATMGDYLNTQATIDSDAYQRALTEQAGADESLINYMNNDMTNAKSYLINMGYMNEDGSWTDEFGKLSQDRQDNISNAYLSATNMTGGGTNANVNSLINGLTAYDDISALRGTYITTTQQGGNTDETIGGGLDNESKTLNIFIQNNGDKLQNGAMFKLQSDVFHKDTAYVLYYNGKYYKVSADTFNNYNGNRYYIEGRKNVVNYEGQDNWGTQNTNTNNNNNNNNNNSKEEDIDWSTFVY